MPIANPHLDSLAVHAGREDLAMFGVHALPIDLSSTNPLPDIERGGASYEAMATGGHPLPDGGSVYQRLWNPTVARFESALAQLEQAETSVAYASGMAAMTAAIVASTSFSGKRHVVAVRPLYGGTDHLLASGLLGVEVTFCAEHEVAASVRSDTALVVLETPANPTLDLVDIATVVAAAGGVPVLVDNTFATPILQNPLTLGAAMSLHSATKYIGGHGDVVGGVIACDEETAARLRQSAPSPAASCTRWVPTSSTAASPPCPPAYGPSSPARSRSRSGCRRIRQSSGSTSPGRTTIGAWSASRCAAPAPWSRSRCAAGTKQPPA